MDETMISRFLGDEYPAAITSDGMRTPLVSERRWTRIYASENHQTCYQISRFMDGSATISLEEFAREWPIWNERERRDFCSACNWLAEQADFPDMLRFIMQHGGPDDWSATANSVAKRLPQDEAFEFLTRALHSTELSRACNLTQGISLTGHPKAERVLRAHLATLWSHPDLWQDDKSFNDLAYGAKCCIEHLIEIGAPPGDFTEQVRALSKHVCARNRDSCRRFLGKYFPWLNESQPEGSAPPLPTEA